MTSAKRAATAIVILYAVRLATAEPPEASKGEASQFETSFRLRTWGADVGIGYNGVSLIPGLTTTLRADGGGAYEKYGFWRDANDSILASPDASVLENGQYDNLNFEWSLGIEQGFIGGEPGGKDLISAFAYYQGRTDQRIADPALAQLVFASGRDDAQADFINSLIAGLHLDARNRKPVTGVESGYWIEASAEWGPAPLSSIGTDYARFNVNAMGFLPLFELEKSGMNLLSAYLGNFASADYAVGRNIPMFVAGSLGGTSVASRAGLGDAVRGIDKYRYDTNFKFVDNIEVHFNGPSIVLPGIYPVLVAFADLGFFAQLGEKTAVPLSGFRYSLGAELRVNILDRVYPGLGYVYCLNDTAGGKNSNIYVSFMLKFK